MDITVVIPARNAGPYLSNTLDSIAGQTLPPHEVVVVDDGSTDETAHIARKFGARVIVGEGKGAAFALNLGIAAATTELIAHFDADDVMSPDKLAKQVAPFAVDARSSLGLVSSDLRMFDEEGEAGETFLQRGVRQLPASIAETWVRMYSLLAGGEWRPWSSDESARYLIYAHLIDVKGLYRKSAWQTVGGFDPSFRCAYDMDFVWRVSRQYEIGLIPEVLFFGRRHASNLSGDPTLVAHECARLFGRMVEDIDPENEKNVLRARRRRELFDIAYIHRKHRQWAKSARYYLQAVVA